MVSLSVPAPLLMGLGASEARAEVGVSPEIMSYVAGGGATGLAGPVDSSDCNSL